MLVTFKQITNSVYRKKVHWKLVNKPTNKHKGTELKSFPMNRKKNKIKFLLGSCHDRKIGPIIQETPGNKADICCVFKPSAPLSNIADDIRKFGKGLMKQDHIIAGGARKQLKIISTSS
jgi:hypothetical protein